MSNIQIAEKSVLSSIEESVRHNGQDTLILDHNFKPISSKDIEPLQKKKTIHRFSLPIGGGWIYYKFKLPNTDKWFVGKVYKQSIPNGAIAIGYKKAISMLYGEIVADTPQNQAKWGKIRDDAEGEVIVYTEEEFYTDLPNPNNEAENKLLHEVSEGNTKNIN